MVRGSPAVRSRPAVLGLCVMGGLWPFGPVSASLCLLDGHLGLPTPTPPSNHLCPSVLRRSLLLPAPLALCLLTVFQWEARVGAWKAGEVGCFFFPDPSLHWTSVRGCLTP